MVSSRTIPIDFLRSYSKHRKILENIGLFTRISNIHTTTSLTPTTSIASNNAYYYYQTFSTNITISNQQQYTLVSLYNNNPISLFDTTQKQQQRRWKSTVSATKDSFENLRSTQDSSSTSTSSSTENNTSLPTTNDNDAILTATTTGNDNDSTTKINTSGEVPQPKRSLGSTLRYRAKCIRDDARNSYEDMKHDARDKYQEFKDNPSDTALAGAKSMGGMIRMYGPVFIGTYGAVYFSTLGLLFMGVQGGILDPISLMAMMRGPEEVAYTSTYEFVVNFMNTHNFTKPYTYIVENNPAYANLAMAWIAVKFTEPIRLGVALTITPRVSRYLGYTPKIVDVTADDKKSKDVANKTEVDHKDETIKKSEPVLKS